MLAPGWLGRKKHHFLQEDKQDALPYCCAQVLWICFFTFVFRLLGLGFCKKCDIGVHFFFISTENSFFTQQSVGFCIYWSVCGLWSPANLSGLIQHHTIPTTPPLQSPDISKDKSCASLTSNPFSFFRSTLAIFRPFCLRIKLPSSMSNK